MRPPEKYRTVVRYKDYFDLFFKKQRLTVKKKIIWTLELIEDLERVPEKYLKHLSGTNGLYEIRVRSGSDIFRIICFFDHEKLVILMNGFNKKSQKIPRIEIHRAYKIKAAYEKEKQQS